ncbi:hypothetical protein GUITHDRAFT_143236 [Guillardia theta CCMP2712]|uniref:Uncharacterized protein n=1 Tax=Guillardia theta (strain CCMP2712) TaxID=905079 RepID=L1I4N3_GUITC|nr:hypothetical protein GUITHDRAFT_149426 [Guillardia theta CCMP2712]XP_005826841.1 hypothetical protein GUITHDRAFT_143236 [Guillardia theta CCMP2712]EKX31243.1 hypothetical protein GUITHDRAFT_149426 [Guillardia theta CCMP2712]EKX39861.1 hypothetical protein GUITHDRAFT_143236 [Guillardia theta CCMP2712]|eukprot:XP_005818223.1 hypothetical protein GUITHDRAFT_149426 [Guillardia theta CCMP2712]
MPIKRKARRSSIGMSKKPKVSLALVPWEWSRWANIEPQVQQPLLNFFGVKIESNDHFDNLKVVEYEAWIRRMFQHQAFDKVKQTKLQYESEIDKMQQKHALELENKDRLIAALLKRIPKKF